jgi:cardiolipin synthase A/B
MTEKSKKRRTVEIPLMLFVGLILIILALGILLWSAKWRRDPHSLRVSSPGELRALLPSIAGLTQGSLDAGNRVIITQNGDGFFPLLFRDIAAAKETIHIETYIWWDGKVARDLAALLAKKAREGVEVRVLVDGSGGRQIKHVEEMMKDAGVTVARFHPIRISNLGRLNNRDHRKIWLIDGRIAYLGGYGIADDWTGNAQDKKHWRDTGVRVEGPAVNRIQGAFCENWIEETGEILAGDKYFPKATAAGPTTTHLAYTSPSGSVSSVQTLYYLAIKAAKHEIIIQNPYLLPERDAIEAMEEAVQRGVRVWVMVPSATATDSPIVQHASHHHFGSLLKRGVRIWEYHRTLLHQKIVIVDGTWSAVGSTNFDARSFEVNDEITIGIVDPGIAAQLRAAFDEDLKLSRERKFQEWQNRSWWHKLKDGLAYVAHEQL